MNRQKNRKFLRETAEKHKILGNQQNPEVLASQSLQTQEETIIFAGFKVNNCVLLPFNTSTGTKLLQSLLAALRCFRAGFGRFVNFFEALCELLSGAKRLIVELPIEKLFRSPPQIRHWVAELNYIKITFHDSFFFRAREKFLIARAAIFPRRISQLRIFALGRIGDAIEKETSFAIKINKFAYSSELASEKQMIIFLVSFHCSRRLSFSRREHEFTGGLLHRRGDLPIEIPKKAQRQWTRCVNIISRSPSNETFFDCFFFSSRELSSIAFFAFLSFPAAHSTTNKKASQCSSWEKNFRFLIFALKVKLPSVR